MRRAWRGGPRTLLKTIDANIDCAFVENAIVFSVPNIWRGCAPLVPPLTTPLVAVQDCALVIVSGYRSSQEEDRSGPDHADTTASS